MLTRKSIIIGGPKPSAGPVRKGTRRWLLAALTMLAVTGLAFGAYFQDFQFDDFDWTGVTRVTTGTHGVPSKSGTWHAENETLRGNPFTRWGGYSRTFPPGGYTTTIDIYLDIAPPYMTGSLMPYPNDTRFDWTSAINMPNCAHRRDFAFNAGFYTDTDTVPPG